MRFNLKRKDIARPAVFLRFRAVRESQCRVVELLLQGNATAFRQLYKRRLHDLPVGLLSGKGARVFEIAQRELIEIPPSPAQWP